MFLARLILNPHSRDVHRDLADCQRMHRRVLSLFPKIPNNGDARSQLGVLYRVEPFQGRGIPLLVQAAYPPDPKGLPSGYLLDTGGYPPPWQVKEIDTYYGALQNGQRLVFRLRANPTKKTDSWQGREGARPNGRRVDLRRDEDRLAWIKRKADQHGFRLLKVTLRPSHEGSLPDVLQVDPRPAGRVIGHQDAGGGRTHRLTFAAVIYEGSLEIVDKDLFLQALYHGIGPAKAYGFGLLSVAPLRE